MLIVKRMSKEAEDMVSHVQVCLQGSVSHSYEVDKFPLRIDPDLKQAERDRHMKDNQEERLWIGLS